MKKCLGLWIRWRRQYFWLRSRLKRINPHGNALAARIRLDCRISQLQGTATGTRMNWWLFSHFERLHHSIHMPVKREVKVTIPV
ncbi:MAG TPA: hypothetical protein VGY56_08825, partial [Verrucomicrobiae bacterium]|nr:hypothetical protein [Verrucomicrobiae bacterium]